MKEKKTIKCVRLLSDEPISKDDGIFTFSVASSEPYERESKKLGRYNEVLIISDEAIDFSRMVDGRCPFLLEHDTEKVLGVVERAYIENGKLYVDVRFSDNAYAQRTLDDIKAGIRRNTSIGYSIFDYKMKNDGESIPTMLVTRWMPYECSSVAVPADASVGFNRAMEDNEDTIEKIEKLTAELKELKEQCGKIAAEAKSAAESNDDADDETKEEETVIEAVVEAVAEEPAEEPIEKKITVEQAEEQFESETKACGEENEEVKACDEPEKTEEKACDDEEEIRALGKLVGNETDAESFIAQKRSLNEFKNYLNQQPSKESNTMNENKHFSVARAILNQMGKINDEAASYERSIIEENKRNLGINSNEIIVTKSQLRAGFDGTADAALHPAEYRPDLYAGTLAKENTLDRVGARVVPTNGPSISFAVATSGLNAGYVDANGDIPSANMTFAQKTLTPHKYGAYTDVSYISRLQDNPAAESIAFDELIKGLDYVKDVAAFQGTGSDGQPTGLLNATGLNEVPLTGTVELSTALAFEKEIRDSGDYSSDLKWVFGTQAYYDWCNTPVKLTAQNEFMIDYKTGKCIGYEAVCSPAVPPSAVILGNFNEMLVADFDGIELRIVEDATLATKQAVRVLGFGANDVAVRRPASFTKGV